MRVNFNYFISEPVFQFVLDAIHFVAEPRLQAPAALPLRISRPGSGSPAGRARAPRRAWSTSRTARASSSTARSTRPSPEWALSGYLEEAARIVAEAERDYRTMDPLGDDALPQDAEALRWFPLPEEVLCEMLGREPPTRCALRIDATT